ncbi:MAG: tyrosine-type recombinase/integrase [Anaerolineae bacterium]|nr:tyrosine-type recombinase/integrase [Anaerolineae bacterium]
MNFSIDPDGRLTLDLSNPPEWLTTITIKLPNNQTVTHQVGDPEPEPTGLPLRRFIPELLKYLEINEDRKAHTREGYRLRVGQFCDWLDQHPDHDPADAQVWLDYYGELKSRDLSPYTVKGHYHILVRFGRWLLERGYLREQPLADVRPPALPKNKKPKAITEAHINTLIEAAESPRDRAVLLFFRDTGCRAAEAVGLTWGDVQIDEGEAQVTGKGNKSRPLFFKPITGEALKLYRAGLKHSKPADPVWWGHQGPLSYQGIYLIFKRLAEKTGLIDEVFNPHAWRHAFGRDTTKRGIPTATLSDLMGHTTTDVTKIYTTFNTDELKAAHHRYSPVNGNNP